MRWVLGAVLIALLAYLAICVLLYAGQRRLLYYPQFTRIDAAATNYVLPREEGVVLRGWRLHPAQARVMLYFGGNAEDLRGFRDFADQAFPGHSVYLLAYRGYGASDGRPSETALLADALALYDRASAEHPGAPVAVIGRSLGSGVASYVAGQRPVARLALVTPFDSLLATAQAHYRWIPVSLLLRDRYPSVDYLQHYASALLVLRAGRDQVVPPSNTDHLLAALHRPVQVQAFDSADHIDISNAPGYASALVRFFD